MCGLIGFVGEGACAHAAAPFARQMADALAHRGPDDVGVWVDPDGGAVLGHRRLSVVDLSPSGHQPMSSSSGRVVVAFNGEVYNHLDVRKELDRSSAPPRWRGHSDTETLVEAIDRWGLGEAVGRCVGMFAFAAWDRQERRLALVRDRMGEKPLYYTWCGRTLVFASELKALRFYPGFRAEVSRGALALFLRYGYVPAPYTIYEGVWKVRPGIIVESTPGRTHGATKQEAYWALTDVVASGHAHPFGGGAEEAVEELERLVRASVRGQLQADVPVGAFLSGGVDSSAVVAMAQELSPRPVRTFTIGFEERAHNEAVYARAVAAHLGTDHTELYVQAEDALNVVPALPRMWDEPFADSSQIPTYLVARLARAHVTVSLSGDGGDELFGGYERYVSAARAAAFLPYGPLAAPLLRAASWGGRALSPLGGVRMQVLASRMGVLGDALAAGNQNHLYRAAVSYWKHPEDLVLGVRETPPDVFAEPPDVSDDRVAAFMALDARSYLPDDILVKLDRAAMAVSLETRVPLLDHRIVEFAFSLPATIRSRAGTQKWPLREILYRRVPPNLIERPKMGFALPLAEWLRGPLRPWADALLDPACLEAEGVLRSEPIAACWKDHLSGQADHSYRLWPVLMLQAWLEEERGRPG